MASGCGPLQHEHNIKSEYQIYVYQMTMILLRGITPIFFFSVGRKKSRVYSPLDQASSLSEDVIPYKRIFTFIPCCWVVKISLDSSKSRTSQ